MNKYLLKEIATISISNVDKKTYDGQKVVKLCNYTDVYNNWAITKNNYGKLMVSTASKNEIDKYSLVKGDVAITKDSETKFDIGQSTYIADDMDDLVLGYHCALIRPDETKVMGAYINTYLHTKFATKYFENNASGSGQRYTLTLDSINDFQIFVPSLEKQREIVKLLSDIDKKIEINNRINDNLQQQLKALFAYWFIQFNFPNADGIPYKLSGGALKYSSQLKRNIPQDWEVIPLRELLNECSDSFDYKSIQQTIDLSIMPSNSVAINQLNTSTNFSTNLFFMKKGDILFGSIRPYLRKAGFAPCDGTVTGTVHSFRVKDSRDFNFCLCTMIHSMFFNYAINASTGTKMPVVSSESLLSYKVPYSKVVASQFNEVLEIKNTISNKIMENQRLAKLRDYLLPLLMSGQATIE